MPRFSFICCHIARALPPNRRNMGNTTQDNTRKTFRVYSEHSENTKITLREHLRSVPSCAGCHLIENKLILIYTISQLKISLMVWRISRIAKSPSFVCEVSSFLIVSLSSVAPPLLSYIGVWSKKRGENALDSDD